MRTAILILATLALGAVSSAAYGQASDAAPRVAEPAAAEAPAPASDAAETPGSAPVRSTDATIASAPGQTAETPSARTLATDSAARRARSNLNTTVTSARIGATGWLEAEFAYGAAFRAVRVVRNDVTLHTGTLLLGYAATDEMEFQLGWTMFGVLPSDGFTRTAGTGDPFVAGQFVLRRSPATRNPNVLALRAQLQPGIGQAPASVDGFTAGADLLFTTRFGALEVDANAGVAFNTADTPDYFALPLGARLTWLAMPVLDVYAELTEQIHFTDLRSSQTALGVGAAARPIDRVEVSLTGRIGLSESLPAGALIFGVSVLASELAEP